MKTQLLSAKSKRNIEKGRLCLNLDTMKNLKS